MTDIGVSFHVVRSNGQGAQGLDVWVSEIGGAIYDLGRTGADGGVSRVLRRRRKLRRPPLPPIDDPTDQPTFTVRVQDLDGHALTQPLGPIVGLPASFDLPADESQTRHLALPPSMPGRVAEALRDTPSFGTPGMVFLVRRNGAVWVDSTAGLSRVHRDGVSARAMTNDTIVQLASMSKPITATALFAMLDDWKAIADAVEAKEPVDTLTLTDGSGSRTVSVQHVFAPLFADPAVAAGFLARGLPRPRGADFRPALERFAQGGVTVTPPPAVPPGHFGLLRRVLDGVAPPDVETPFAPLIADRLGPHPEIGPKAGSVTLRHLLLHATTVTDTLEDGQKHEPAGRLAAFDYWQIVRKVVAGPLTVGPPRNYFNTNFTLLTAVIETCTELPFNDYIVPRLFSDPRFAVIRRFVTDPHRQALYYDGTPPDWTGGGRMSDFRDWPGTGGFYVTGAAFTDWLHALYTGQDVQRVDGMRPLVSQTAHNSLFGTKAFFSIGIANRGLSALIRRHYQHNGGTSSSDGGGVMGNLAIITDIHGAIYTALFVANSAPPTGADPPFNNAIAALFAGEFIVPREPTP
jgi:CubicO group peptidase (beta-lactamase class C family)